MRILLITRLFPLPSNVARGTFVADHVELLQELGHEVKVLNVLPRILKMNEARRSTMEGTSSAPKSFNHGEIEVQVKRHWEFPEIPLLTAISSRRISIDWEPDVIICHTIWPVANTAERLAKKLQIPWVAVVHGYDFDVALKDYRKKRVEKLSKSADRLVIVSNSLQRFGATIIPCHVNVDQEWKRPMKKFNGIFRKSKIDILFPGDPRRPEKNHILALRVGEELETRGWKVGITTLQQQPRPIVWDRMLTADVCLITSKRESGPLVAREAIYCGCPVVAVDVGDLSEWMDTNPYDVDKLADAVEEVLDKGQNIILPEKYSFDSVKNQWNLLLESL